MKQSVPIRRSLLALTVFTLATTGDSLALQDPVTIGSIERTRPGELVLTFSDDGTGEVEDFAVESSPDLETRGWTEVSDVVFSPLEPGSWRAVVPLDPAAASAFFRVLKQGVPLSASFAAPTVSLEEGDDEGGVVVHFTEAFSGTLRYQVDEGGSSTSGSVTVDGGRSAIIPVPTGGRGDDREPGALRVITVQLELEGGAQASYEIGVNSSTTVVVRDNDSLWSGILTLPDGGGEVGIRILHTEQAGDESACFKTDQGGLIPPPRPWERWLFSSFDLDLDAATFSAGIRGISLPSRATIYGMATQLSLVFAAAGADAVTEDEIRGTFDLTTTVPGAEHLGVPSRTGTFIIRRQPPAAPETPAPTES